MVMQIKDRFSLEIESVAFGGHGVGRVDGFVIFVPFTAPGDVVEIEIVERKKKFARGRLLKIIKPSPNGPNRFAVIMASAAAALISISIMNIN